MANDVYTKIRTNSEATSLNKFADNDNPYYNAELEEKKMEIIFENCRYLSDELNSRDNTELGNYTSKIETLQNPQTKNQKWNWAHLQSLKKQKEHAKRLELKQRVLSEEKRDRFARGNAVQEQKEEFEKLIRMKIGVSPSNHQYDYSSIHLGKNKCFNRKINNSSPHIGTISNSYMNIHPVSHIYLPIHDDENYLSQQREYFGIEEPLYNKFSRNQYIRGSQPKSRNSEKEADDRTQH